MNNERTALEDRAAKHAALADPARLQMVDLLGMSDQSPSELQTVLGMPSNLLAHHLQVLEREGIISRARSEGDRRRSYVKLAPSAVTFANASLGTDVRRVVFVCTANSARSQLAEALWRLVSDVPVTSAGTHPAESIARGAASVAKRHGLSIPGMHPRGIDETLQTSDYVITVCDRAHEELGTRAPHWSVPDPVPVGTAKAFDRAYDEIAARVVIFAHQVAGVA